MENIHPDFPAEKKHLEDTLQEMKQIINDLDADMEVRLHKIGKARTNKDEVSAYVHSLMKSDHAAKIYDIENALPSPYFGRVDFREDGTEQFEQFYIGRTKIARLNIRQTTDILVFDWRDPVSAIFYECQNGRAVYEVLGRYRYSGEVRLKRQYKIEDSQLLDMFDDNMLGLINRQQEALIADPFLKERLLQGAGDRLKDIVTSIRSEQNLIIREPLNQVTVIQGVAGSGKSTIGLHRLSYLLYNDKLNPSRLAVVAPNRIFLDYISELLPDLDVQDARQLTFEDIAAAMLQMTPQLVQSSEQTSLARWKGSVQCIAVLQEFLDRKLEKFCLKLSDISLFDQQLIITKQQQLEKVMEGAQVPYNKRLAALENHIRFRIRNFLEVFTVRLQRGEYGFTESRLQRFTQEAELFLKKHFAKWPYLQLLSGYAAVYADKPAWKSLKRLGADIEQLTAHTLPLLQQGEIEREDLAPLCYLQILLDGIEHMEKYDHIVVDEGQDLSLLEYMVLSRLSRNMSFTIMGDMLQGIHAGRGLESWQTLLKEVFATVRSHYFEVNYSYRSAKEIVDLFNQVMPSGRSQAIPVYEIGRQPQIIRAASAIDATRRLAAAISEFKQLGCRSIGVIARRESDCMEIYEALQGTQPEINDLHLITNAAAGYQGGVTIAPVLLAKGLEFDGVLIWNASDTEFGADYLDAKLLYVALSRAMYYLKIFYQDRLTPLLRKER